MKDNYDLTGAHKGPVVSSKKELISIRLDPEIIEWFKQKVEKNGGNYQSLINQVLLDHINSE